MKVQFPCHSKFQCSFRSLRAYAPFRRPFLARRFEPAPHIGALLLRIPMDTFRIDEVARRLMDNLPPAFRATQRDLESNFRAVLRASLGKLDLVTRDEFDTQSRVLERTRARLEALEARVRELETAAGGTESHS
jgi:ubiquinone biosynthesis accessory factor UbiK